MHRFFTDSHGRQTIIMVPNLSLSLWLASLLIGWVVKQQPYHNYIGWVGTVALMTWAVQEIYSGTSMFRRVLGTVVLVVVAMGVVRRLT